MQLRKTCASCAKPKKRRNFCTSSGFCSISPEVCLLRKKLFYSFLKYINFAIIEAKTEPRMSRSFRDTPLRKFVLFFEKWKIFVFVIYVAKYREKYLSHEEVIDNEFVVNLFSFNLISPVGLIVFTTNMREKFRTDATGKIWERVLLLK